MIKIKDCDRKTYNKGVTVGVIPGDKFMLEGFVHSLRRETECEKIDWFYMAGRGVIRAITDDPEKLRAKIPALIESWVENLRCGYIYRG